MKLLLIAIAASLASFAPSPTEVTHQALRVTPGSYDVMVVSPTTGACFQEGEVALDLRCPKAGAGLTKVKVRVSFYWRADAFGFENLNPNLGYQDAWQNFCGGLALRLKPTRRFPQDVWLGHTAVTFQRWRPNLGRFDGSNDCGGNSGGNWYGYYWCGFSNTLEFTDPHVLARFSMSHPGDAGNVRLQFVGPPGGSDYSTWFGTDENGVWHPTQFAGHSWRTRAMIENVGLTAYVTYIY